MSRLRRGLVVLSTAALAAVVVAAARPARVAQDRSREVEVVVTLASPPLAEARPSSNRAIAAFRSPNRRLNFRAPASVAYLARLAHEQAAVQARIEREIPVADVRWRYSAVLNGLAVVVPASAVDRLSRIEGVTEVYPSIRYTAQLDRTPQLIGAPTLWGPGLTSAGNGIKIGIIDDGIDQTHPFFDPAGFSMPAGFPKGQAAYTTAKVIVARAFAPPRTTYANASKPFDPLGSEHATHVAGIAAGDNGVVATSAAGRPRVSGVAPRAYLGNYKALTVPTPGVGLNGNSPELARAVEAAVRDGMDVINLSLGEPEVEPTRDVLVQAIDGAADAGVVPAVAAGNSFLEVGRGSVGSPAAAAKAITVAAVGSGRGSPAGQIADFSSGGPSPFSLRLKPEVSAPGVSVLSSVPSSHGLWAIFSGTSMASPHVAGAAALLRQRHPDWTVAQLKAALVETGDPVVNESRVEVPSMREGGGLIDLPRADVPLVFAEPSVLSFGIVPPGAAAPRTVRFTDAGGGSGTWSVTVESQLTPSPLSVPPTVSVPGSVVANLRADAPVDRDLTGFIVLSRGANRRRIPYWLRVSAPKLTREPATVLRKAGVYRGSTSGKPALVSSYRYPDNPRGVDISNSLDGPEQVFRVRITRRVANFGAVITSQGSGVRVSPRITIGADENRLAGQAGLPLVLNPYTDRLGDPVPVVSVTRPLPGTYGLVFDTPNAAAAGRFTFRLWINDVRPPKIRLLDRSARAGGRFRFVIDDGKGSGVDLSTVVVRLDGAVQRTTYIRGTHIFVVPPFLLTRGTHVLNVVASDYQEAKNDENVAGVLPNTRRFRATFRVK
jgi:subtilisin family serine protease